ncbi:SAM-dependent methyltransferase [Streptomyces sp. NPDC005402]|uniref:SAM-dependent methyltransferase n=1 Tax=Streptomyces sp. NPDC005402 TaxID=3155338 RepID=UPI0033A7294D
MRAESEQARELAEFLRARISASGMTLAELGQSIHRSKAQISHYVSGSVPPADVVDDLIRATVAEPRLRQRLLAEGRRLLHAARLPAPAKPAPQPAHDAGQAATAAPGLYERLINALERLAKLERARSNDRMLIMVLLDMLARAKNPLPHPQAPPPHAARPAGPDRRTDPVGWWVQHSRRHRTSAVHSRLAHAGIRQFLDMDTDSPAGHDTSSAAGSPTAVACRFVYAAHAVDEPQPPTEDADLVEYIDADVRDPAEILWGAAHTLDFSEPIAITMLDVAPLLGVTNEAVDSMHRLLQAMPSGSYLILSRSGAQLAGEPAPTTVHASRGSQAGETKLRDRDDLARFLGEASVLESGGNAYARWCPSAA